MRSCGRLPFLGLLLMMLAACTVSPTNDAMPRCDPEAGPSPALVLAAQSVPTAELVPCVNHLQPGWEFDEFDTRKGRTRFCLDSDRTGKAFLVVTLEAACDIGDAEEVPGGRDPRLPLASDHPGTRRFFDIRQVLPQEDSADVGKYRGAWYFRFEGGCVTYRFAAEGQSLETLAEDVAQALGFVPSEDLRRLAREELDVEFP